MHISTRKIYSFIRTVLVAVLAIGGGLESRAFDTSIYTNNSLLASGGTKVRVGVEHAGIYLVPTQRLRSLGFTDPSKVRVFGYGGRRIDDVMTAESFIDDLPEIYSEYVEGRGLVFYATGTGDWTQSQGSFYHYDQNPYTIRSYYFLSEGPEGSERAKAEKIGGPDSGSRAAETFWAREHHELEQRSPGEAGAMLVGEDFRSNMSRTFDFTLTDPAPDTETEPGGWLECSFVSNMASTNSRLHFSINGSILPSLSTDVLSMSSSNSHIHGAENITRHEFKLPNSKKLSVGITLNGSQIRSANLNYLTINYLRELRLPKEGVLCFSVSGTGGILKDAGSDTRVWDVSEPSKIRVLAAGSGSGNSMQWSTPYNGMRDYAAWKTDATLPEPLEYRQIDQQNLHGTMAEYPEMVIISPVSYNQAAEKIAELHRSEGMNVIITDPEKIYNEFSSGSPDPSGLRKYLKMLYDRSLAANPEAPLRYVMIMSRPTYDHRHLTAGMSGANYPTVPMWMPRANRTALSDTEGYTTDDFIALLEDGSGARPGFDNLCVAVGRVPVTSSEQAMSVAEKLIEYSTSSRAGLWRHRFLFTADDEDGGVHLTQTEAQTKAIESTPGQQHFLRKIYLDAYNRVGERYPEARADLFRYLEEGVLWWNFVGHANTTSWTGNGLLTFTDMNNMYLRNRPFLYTATCDFLRWDSNTVSGGELIFMERHGGGIGAISAVRPVYISDNGWLTEAIGRALAQRDENGHFLTPGEIYRRAKNDIRDASGGRVENTNRLRYVFMGDPALRLAIPDNIITIDLPEGDEDLVLGAGGTYTITGRITHPVTGEILTDFNGNLQAELYDAETSVSTHGWGKGKVCNYEDYGPLLTASAAKVENGVFSMRIAMPETVTQNYRPATLSLFAQSATPSATSGRKTEAVGLVRDLYVYGENFTGVDTEAPSIDLMVLNHHTFTNGSTVNPSPVLIAEVSDNVGINIANTGIGRQMTATLDGKTVYSQIVSGYTSYDDGRPGGKIIYTLENLSTGAHSLQLRVWDTSGNRAEKSIDFYVQQDKAPVVYDVYTDTNPASTVANFYVSHDRPEAMCTVSVTVYNLLGKPVWTGSAQGPSDMFESVPVTWNLCDMAGRRVPRGIYVYRASIKADGDTYETASRRLAVTER
ncbi:MAG: type IX secretion system sortase PorU [Muribaculaceae bacterium]|nr:type IX secretion system sortase PorU [Muribaculaceae bacterium]